MSDRPAAAVAPRQAGQAREVSHFLPARSGQPSSASSAPVPLGLAGRAESVYVRASFHARAQFAVGADGSVHGFCCSSRRGESAASAASPCGRRERSSAVVEPFVSTRSVRRRPPGRPPCWRHVRLPASPSKHFAGGYAREVAGCRGNPRRERRSFYVSCFAWLVQAGILAFSASPDRIIPRLVVLLIFSAQNVCFMDESASPAPSGSPVHPGAEDASPPSGCVAGGPRRDFDRTAAARAAVAHAASGEKAPSRPGRRPPANAGQAPGRRPPGRSALARIPRVGAVAGSSLGLPPPAGRCLPPASNRPPGGRVLDRPRRGAPAHRSDLLPNRRRRPCHGVRSSSRRLARPRRRQHRLRRSGRVRPAAVVREVAAAVAAGAALVRGAAAQETRSARAAARPPDRSPGRAGRDHPTRPATHLRQARPQGRAALELIQLRLYHASLRTTERYLGLEQNLYEAPCDRLGIRGWGGETWHGRYGHQLKAPRSRACLAPLGVCKVRLRMPCAGAPYLPTGTVSMASIPSLPADCSDNR